MTHLPTLLGLTGDHDTTGQEPADIVTNVEQQEARHRDVEGAGPSRLFGHCRDNQDNQSVTEVWIGIIDFLTLAS